MSDTKNMSLSARVERALNRVAKWRTVFVSWQLGTRVKGDPEADAVKDAAEQRIMQRVELSALASLLIKKGVFTIEEFNEELITEAAALEKMLERRFPGFKANDHGMDVNVALARDTMQGWRS